MGGEEGGLAARPLGCRPGESEGNGVDQRKYIMENRGVHVVRPPDAAAGGQPPRVTTARPPDTIIIRMLS